MHSEIAVGVLAAQGWIARHLHSFEETLYILEGELVLELDGHAHRLAPGDFALIPIGVRHTLANVGGGAVRWFPPIRRSDSIRRAAAATRTTRARRLTSLRSGTARNVLIRPA